MKFLMLFLICAVPAMAEEDNFAAAKAKILSHLEEGIAVMQKHRDCVTAASDKPALKACRVEHKEVMKAHRQERKTEREETKARRKSRKD